MQWGFCAAEGSFLRYAARHMLAWENLAPHRPLNGEDPRYVNRTLVEDHLGKSLEKSHSPFLIAGAAGVGKSTEVARAASWLSRRPKIGAVLVRIDRLYDMRTVGEAQLLEAILHALPESRSRRKARLARLLTGTPIPPEFTSSDPRRVLDALKAEVQSFTNETQHRLVVIVDGLEKCTEKLAGQLVRALLELRELFTVAVVVPPSLVVGPGNQDLVQLYDARIYAIRAVYIGTYTNEMGWGIEPGPLEDPGQRFFYELAERRLGPLTESPPEFQEQIRWMAYYSGGVPRVFLRLLELAHSSAQVADREWPQVSDFNDAVLEEQRSLELALRDGDISELRALKRRDKLDIEIPIERRLRFLGHGVLLEYETAMESRLVKVTPLLFSLVARG